MGSCANEEVKEFEDALFRSYVDSSLWARLCTLARMRGPRISDKVVSELQESLEPAAHERSFHDDAFHEGVFLARLLPLVNLCDEMANRRWTRSDSRHLDREVKRAFAWIVHRLGVEEAERTAARIAKDMVPVDAMFRKQTGIRTSYGLNRLAAEIGRLLGIEGLLDALLMERDGARRICAWFVVSYVIEVASFAKLPRSSGDSSRERTAPDEAIEPEAR